MEHQTEASTVAKEPSLGGGFFSFLESLEDPLHYSDIADNEIYHNRVMHNAAEHAKAIDTEVDYNWRVLTQTLQEENMELSNTQSSISAALTDVEKQLIGVKAECAAVKSQNENLTHTKNSIEQEMKLLVNFLAKISAEKSETEAQLEKAQKTMKMLSAKVEKDKTSIGRGGSTVLSADSEVAKRSTETNGRIRAKKASGKTESSSLPPRAGRKAATVTKEVTTNTIRPPPGRKQTISVKEPSRNGEDELDKQPPVIKTRRAAAASTSTNLPRGVETQSQPPRAVSLDVKLADKDDHELQEPRRQSTETRKQPARKTSSKAGSVRRNVPAEVTKTPATNLSRTPLRDRLRSRSRPQAEPNV